jgi:hypothetical protein
MSEEKLVEEIENLLNSLSPEIKAEAKSILKGERGLMSVTSNNIEIVWVHPCGYGRKVKLHVTDEGRKEFEKVNAMCRKQFDFIKKKQERGY